MNDLAFLGIIIGFFVLATMFVFACDRIIGVGEGTAIDALTAEQKRAAG